MIIIPKSISVQSQQRLGMDACQPLIKKNLPANIYIQLFRKLSNDIDPEGEDWDDRVVWVTGFLVELVFKKIDCSETAHFDNFIEAKMYFEALHERFRGMSDDEIKAVEENYS